jgi:hypothetical protein
VLLLDTCVEIIRYDQRDALHVCSTSA